MLIGKSPSEIDYLISLPAGTGCHRNERPAELSLSRARARCASVEKCRERREVRERDTSGKNASVEEVEEVRFNPLSERETKKSTGRPASRRNNKPGTVEPPRP